MFCSLPNAARAAPDQFPDPQRDLGTASDEATAVLAGGCFWCTEAVFERLDGVLDVESGYTGGSAETANYSAVCSGRTGHAEAIRIRYQPQRISYGQLLKLFFSVAHDPTQHDRQGNDRGRQYRSAIFYGNDAEREVAAAYIRQLDDAGVFDAPIVTQLQPLKDFYAAEATHQDFARRNPDQPYIAAVARPKVEKLERYCAERLKS